MEVGVERVWLSGTSSIPLPSAITSTAQIPPAQVLAGIPLKKSTRLDSLANNDASWFDKWGLYFTIIAIPIAGIIGYFSGILALKDNISDNKAAISVLQTDIGYLKNTLENEVKTVAELKNDLNSIKNQNNTSSNLLQK